MKLFFVAWLLIGIAGAYWIFLRPRMNVVKQRHLSPHERWPQILHWRQGDEFDCHVDYSGKHYYSLRLIALTEDGFAYCSESGHKVKIHVSALVGHNESFITRRVDDELQQSNEYMELLREFNVAVDELKRRDKMRLVG